MVKFYEGVFDSVRPYVVAVAWWHAVPTQPKGMTGRVRSRMQMMLDLGREIELPPLPNEVAFLVELLFEVGPISVSGEGTMPLTWQDLAVFQTALGVSLPLWQTRLLRRLSLEYLIQHRAAVDPDAPKPWETTVTPLRRTKVAEHVRGILRG